MAKKEQEVRRTRDHFLITFNDGDTETWKIGNLAKFLRHLYMDNKILRDLNPNIKSSRQFSMKMQQRMASGLIYALDKRGENFANFNLVDKECEEAYKMFYGGTITRVYMSRFKGFQ